MRCDRFEARWQRLLDRRRSPENDVALQRHAAVCADCRRLLYAQQQLFDGLEHAEIPALDPGFADRVVARVGNPPVRPRTSIGWGPLASLAVSVCLLLALLPVVLKIRSASRTSTTSTVKTAVATSEPHRRSPKLVRHDRVSSPAPTQWWVMPPETLGELYPPEVRKRHRQQVGRLAEDLRPITHSFTAAAHALRRTIPVGKKPDKSRAPQARLLHRIEFGDLT